MPQNDITTKDGEYEIFFSKTINILQDNFTFENMFGEFDIKFKFIESDDKSKNNNDAGKIKSTPKDDHLLVELINLKSVLGASSGRIKIGDNDDYVFFFSVFFASVTEKFKNLTVTFYRKEK